MYLTILACSDGYPASLHHLDVGATTCTTIRLSMLPPCRRQRLRTTRLTRRIQRLDSRTISFLVRMVIALGHRHRLVPGEVVDLLDGDAEERLLRIDFFQS